MVIIALWIGFTWGNKSAVAPEMPTGEEATTEQVATTTIPTPAVVRPTKTTTTVMPKTTTTPTITPVMTKDGAYVVSYTNTGFSPKTLTIKLGKSVHFVNNSSKAMSITTTTTQNQVQSELNQGKTVGQGGTYDFTFLTAGTWVYMNRNAQTDFGTIIVE